MYITDLLATNHTVVSLCSLHRPCSVTKKCAAGGKQPVFDFDQITKEYRQRRGLPSCASVDALTAKGESICFVEIKGWQEYLEHTPRLSENKIRKQTERYDLAYKLSCSIQTLLSLLCEQDETLEMRFADTPKCYIIVTDVDVRQNPLESFAGNLNLLAETASSWEHVCWKYLKEKAEQVKEMKTVFISCREFDETMRQDSE